MLRGEFIRGDGLVIPNNITTYGAQTLLGLALLNSTYALNLALVNAAPDVGLQLESLNEPTIGVNGYARIAVTRDILGWPSTGVLNGEVYYETDWAIWAAVGGDFDKAITRMALVNHPTLAVGNYVIALSGALPAEIIITPTTPEADRKFKYRIYSR